MKLFNHVKEIAHFGMSGMLALGIAAGAVSTAQAGLAEVDGQKRIVYQPAANRAGLDVQFDALKHHYAVNEAINFKVKGTREFFLYVFNIDRANNQAVMILPNDIQSGNKYPANKWFGVPNTNVEFYSDRPGIEEVVVVASTKWIDFNTKSYKQMGKFMIGDLAPIDTQLKALRVRPSRPAPVANSNQVVVRDLALRISGDPIVGTGSGTTLMDPAPAPIASPAAVTGGAIPFISTDDTEYRLGEKVNMAYGADTAGWLHLYTQEPDGAVTLLKREKVDGRSIYKTAAYTQGMYGHHALIAAFTKDKSFDTSKLKNYVGNNTKAISIMPNEPAAVSSNTVMNVAVRRFMVTR